MRFPTLTLAALALFHASAALAAPIIWGGGPRAILSDADVSTNGVLVRAMAKAGAAAPVVNGVTFAPFPGPDTLSGQNAVNYAAGALPTGGGISAAYATLLSQNDHRTTTGTGAGTTMTLTLNQLVVGQHYEVQLWFHDGNASGLGTLMVKSPASLDPWVLLDANPANVAGGRGQHAIGTFTADATTQVINLTGNPIVALQAYQLRRVPAPLAQVAWESWKETTGPSDVSTQGTLARAYAFGGTAPAAAINGVSFSRFIDQSGDTLSGFTSVGTDGFGSAAAPFSTLPVDYRTLLAGAASGGRAGTLTLNGLQPGQWYQVQVWANDSRAAAGGRIQRINGSLFLNTNPGGPADNLAHEGGLGHWMQGAFQATAAAQRFDFVSSTAVQLNALQLRAIPAPDSALMALRNRRLMALHAYLDGTFTTSINWVGVQARFAIGDLARARSSLTTAAAGAASGTLVPTSSFHLWPAMDLFMRRKKYIDELSRERMISTLRRFDYRNWSNTSNLSKLAWTMRTLGSQEFGESSFIFPANAWRDADPRGYGPLLARLEQEARQGTGEYASAPYGWYNIMPTLSLAQLSDDPVLQSRARVCFDAHLAQLAAQWMPGSYLATWSGRSYPLSGSAMSLGRLLWYWFGDGGRAGEAQEILMPASMDYEPPLGILRAATERTTVHTTRHRCDSFQTAHIYKNEYGFFSHDGAGGGDQQYPDGLRWRGMQSYLWVTRPAVDTPATVRASNAPGNANADYSTLQHRDAQVMAFDLSYRTIDIPYALGYVPGNYTAMINQTGAATPADGRPRIFLSYDRVMVAITADVPFTWDPASGIYCPWPNIRTGDSEFRIAVGGVGFPRVDPTGFTATVDRANNRFAIAIEVGHPEEFAGTTAAEKLAAFQASILANTSLTRDPTTSPTTARYTTRRGDQLRVTSKSGTGLKTAFVNNVPVNYDDTWPMIENPWISQPQRGANITMNGSGTQTLLNLANWTRTESTPPIIDPLPVIAAATARGITTSAGTAVGTLTHPGVPAAEVTLHWGTSDAGTSNPTAWANSVPLGTVSAGQLLVNLSGLPADTNHVYRFRAVNAAGTVWTAATTFRTSAIPPPGVPGNLRFTLTAGSVPLTWDAMPDAASYLVRRATASTGPFTTLASGLTTPAFTDTTAVSGTTYFYVVAAVGPGGTSGDSGQLQATPAVLPAAPTGLAASTVYRFARLTWTAVPWAASYTVKRGSTSTGPFTTIATGLTDTSFEDTTSVHGVTYHYVVSATNLVGEGPNSASRSIAVNVGSHIAETSGSWSSIAWFPPARGIPVSGTSTIVDFDNQSAAITSQQDRGAFTLNQLRFFGQNVSLSGDGLTLAGTNPRVTVAASSSSSIGNAVTLSTATTFDVSGALTLGSTLSGTVNLTKIGAGTLTLAQTNPHTGGILVGGGTVRFTAPQPGLRTLTYGTTVAATTGGRFEFTENATAQAINVQTTNARNELVIAPGRTLTVTGTHTQGGVNNGISASHLAISGGGAFRYDNAAATFAVRRASTLDLTDSGPVTIIASRFLLGDIDNNTGSQPSTLLLSGNADTLIRADTVSLSSQTAGGTGIRGESTRLQSMGGPGKLTIRNTAGTGPALLEMDRNASSAIVTTNLDVDLRGQPMDLWLSEMHLSCRSQTNAASSTSTFFFDTGTLRVDGITRIAVGESGGSDNLAIVEIGGGDVFFTGGLDLAYATNGQNAEAELTISGGSVLSGPISMVTSNPGYVIGTLNVTGGSLTLSGPISRGPIGGLAAGNYASTGSARLILDGGVLDLGGHAIGSTSAPLQTVSMMSGTLKNVASINGGAGFTKLAPGLLVIDGVNTWSGATTISLDTLEMAGTLTSAGTLTIGLEATLTGSGIVRAPVIIQGTVQPGSATGAALRLERNVTLASTATVLSRIDRASPATTRAISGATSLAYGGTLRVTNDGAALQAGDRFVLFTATAYQGNFSSFDLPVLPAGLAWDTRGLFADGSLMVRTSAELAESLANTTKYWDRGAAVGLQSGAGAWDAGLAANWSPLADGSTAPGTFWHGDTVHFQTGGLNAVTLTGPVAVAALHQSLPGTATTISGGTLLLNGPSPLNNGAGSGNQPLVIDSAVVVNGQAVTVNAQQPISLLRGLAGLGSLTKTGASTLSIAGDTTWGSDLILDGGTVSFSGLTPGLNTLTFGAAAASVSSSTLQLGQSATLSSLNVRSLGINALSIAAGRTVTVNGPAIIGLNGATVTGTGSTTLNTAGGGSLVVNTPGGDFIVAGSRSGHGGTADFTGLSSLTVDTGSTGDVFLGVYWTNASGALRLAPTSTLTAANLFVGDANGGGTHTLLLGAGVNLLNTTNVYVGQKPAANNRSDAVVDFVSGQSTGSVRLRAADGSSRASLFINDNSSTTGRTLVNTFDVSGHSADLLLDQLVIGRRNASSSPAQLTNDTFRWDRGTLDVQQQVILEQAPAAAQKLHVGQMVLGSASSTAADTAIFRGGLLVAQNRSTVTTAAASVTATLSIAGGSVTTAGITLGDITTLTAPTAGTRQSNATLEITGGTLTLTAPLRSGSTGGPGTKTAVLTLNGGTLDLGGNDLGGTGTTALTTLNFQSGTLRNVASINGSAGLTKTTAGTLTLAGTNTFTGPIAVNAGTLRLTGSVTAPVSVASGATLIHGGTVSGDITLASGATDAPDTTPTQASLSGHYTLPAGATLRLRLDSATSFDQITLTGSSSTITLGGTLDLIAAPDLPTGTRFRLFRNTGQPAATVVGTFASRPHGQPFTLAGHTWYLDYTAGSGGDIDLVLATPLELWRHAQFGSLANTGPAADDADPDADGTGNFLEYALGTTPASAASRPNLESQISNLKLQLTFRRARADLTYIVEASTTLAPDSWQPIATNPGTVGDLVTVQDSIEVTTANPPRRFIRLRVISPP